VSAGLDGFAGAASGPVAGLVDVATLVTVPASRQSSLEYSETDSFDRILHSAMKGQTTAINVDMFESQITKAQMIAPGSIGVQSPRMQRWLSKVRDTGGMSIACEEPRSRFMAALAMLGLKIGTALIRDYVTYKPAKLYHARSTFNPEENNRLIRVEFVRRDIVPKIDCDTQLPNA
jgi:hypothetical protein